MEAGSSWNFNGVPVTYKCDLCLEHKSQAPVQLNDSHTICEACFVSDLKPRFEAAKASEQSWPVTFGTAIHPSSFPGFFSSGFILSYTEKEKEYTTPLLSRVYCAALPCGKFLGSLGVDSQLTFTCTCGSATCTRCKELIQGAITHACGPEEPENDPFDGLRITRCPNSQCRLPIELLDACNNVKCRCGQVFCIVCGKEAKEGSGHWGPGGCPRWNHPDDANAQYDNPTEAHVDNVFHHVEQLRPVRGPASALLTQAMEALAADRPRPPQPPRMEPQPVVQREQQRGPGESRNDILRRAANDTAARMGFMATRGRDRRRLP